MAETKSQNNSPNSSKTSESSSNISSHGSSHSSQGSKSSSRSASKEKKRKRSNSRESSRKESRKGSEQITANIIAGALTAGGGGGEKLLQRLETQVASARTSQANSRTNSQASDAGDLPPSYSQGLGVFEIGLDTDQFNIVTIPTARNVLETMTSCVGTTCRIAGSVATSLIGLCSGLQIHGLPPMQGPQHRTSYSTTIAGAISTMANIVDETGETFELNVTESLNSKLERRLETLRHLLAEEERNANLIAEIHDIEASRDVVRARIAAIKKDTASRKKGHTKRGGKKGAKKTRKHAK
jgi:hypothetical protein